MPLALLLNTRYQTYGKMRTLRRHMLLLSTAALLLTSACTTSKSLYKDALKYESSGLDEEALRSLKRSLSKRIDNVDARLRIEKVGQRVLNARLDEFNRSSMMKEYGSAVKEYRLAKQIVDELRPYRVTLDIPRHYTETFITVKETYLGDLYEEGLREMDEERFSSAETLFNKILDIDPEYRDVRELRDGAECEPVYRQAIRAFDNGDFRKAYTLFDRCVRTGDYKDSRARRDECVELGQVRVAIVPFENRTSTRNADELMQAHALEAMMDIDDPFIRVIERADLDKIIEEQNLGLTGVIDQATSSELGRITGANAIVVGQIMEYAITTGRPQKVKQRGYVSQEKTVLTSEGQKKKVTTYRPVDYYTYEDSRSVRISFHYKLIDVSTAEVLSSDIINREEVDRVEYTSFDGDKRKLFPERDGKVDLDRKNYNRLRNSVDARREMRSLTQIADNLLDEVGRKMATDLASSL